MTRSSQKSVERVAVAAALARLATSSKDCATTEPAKYRVKVTKEPHVDPRVAVYGGETKEESVSGVEPVQDCKGKGKARADCADTQKVTSFYRLNLSDRV